MRIPGTSLQKGRGLALLVAFLGLFALDGLLFRTPFYPSIVQMDSSTGAFELTLRREQQAQTRNGDNLVVTLGDSRFAYSPRLANQVTAQTGYVFRHAGVAGTDVRSWYYMLRDLDPTARRYRAVVFGVTDYDDEDEFFTPDDDIRALHYAIARLRWSDVLEFALSFHSRNVQWEALRGASLKGIVYQNDLLAFLAKPAERIRRVRIERRDFDKWTYDYLETPRSMAGLQIDWKAWKVTFPPGLDQDQQDTVNGDLMRAPAPQTGRVAAFRRAWYGRILDRYRGSRTKIIFVRLPRGPIPRPAGLVRKKSATIREFASLPNVLLCDEHAFDSLEHPELFRDGMHLNRAGVAQFSPMLAEDISRMLGSAAR
ncbi:MAG: hypothetical protein ABSG79_20505 [Bryobacteraceae bacterium]